MIEPKDRISHAIEQGLFVPEIVGGETVGHLPASWVQHCRSCRQLYTHKAKLRVCGSGEHWLAQCLFCNELGHADPPVGFLREPGRRTDLKSRCS